jgi:TatD DNase family protein
VQLFDTHSHLFLKEFDPDRADIVARALGARVQRVVLPAIDSSTHDALLAMAQQYPTFCIPLMGLHPTSVSTNFEEELTIVENLLANHKFYGIGEIGIDLYWDKTYIEEQKIAFTHQVRLAKKLRLPIVIHTREAFPEVLSIIDNENSSDLTGVFHSFSGGIDEYNRIASYGGFMVGIGGVVTFKNGGIDKVLRSMDINKMVLETDSPYLAPVPHRGKRNESAYLPIIANRIAEILGTTATHVAMVTTQNASNLFQVKM